MVVFRGQVAEDGGRTRTSGEWGSAKLVGGRGAANEKPGSGDPNKPTSQEENGESEVGSVSGVSSCEVRIEKLRMRAEGDGLSAHDRRLGHRRLFGADDLCPAYQVALQAWLKCASGQFAPMKSGFVFVAIVGPRDGHGKCHGGGYREDDSRDDDDGDRVHGNTARVLPFVSGDFASIALSRAGIAHRPDAFLHRR